jgi:predicted CoA-binding protein
LVENGYDNFWYQPGAESAEISEYLDSNKKNYIDDKCIMVVSNLIDKY